MSNLSQIYKTEIIKKLSDEFDLSNMQACPKLVKIVVNCGLGEATKSGQILDDVAEHIAKITGQRPVKTFAKRSISGFKLRRGQAIGLKVTLRGGRMYDFLEKLIKVTLPRLRDFRGLPVKNFDQSGNYTLGFREISVFPETATVPAEKTRGLEITIVINSNEIEKSKRLLESLGLPFARN